MWTTITDPLSSFFFFFNDTATTEIYTLSLHDALPIFSADDLIYSAFPIGDVGVQVVGQHRPHPDRKSTRLNSSHSQISYAVFCLKKKKTQAKNVTNHLIDK